MSDQKILDAIKVECDRQHVGEDRQAMLRTAYSWLKMNCDFGCMTELRLLHIAHQIEPDNNGQYRTTPVTFNGVVGGVPPKNIYTSIRAWIRYFDEELHFSRMANLGEVCADPIIKEFLDIHPFIDGNGRIAWLLRVWMLNQWEDPQPLPDYSSQK